MNKIFKNFRIENPNFYFSGSKMIDYTVDERLQMARWYFELKSAPKVQLVFSKNYLHRPMPATTTIIKYAKQFAKFGTVSCARSGRSAGSLNGCEAPTIDRKIAAENSQIAGNGYQKLNRLGSGLSFNPKVESKIILKKS